MANIKVSIVNPTTLRLDEPGNAGDIIDLKELASVDNSSILEAIKHNKDETYKTQINKEIEHLRAKMALEMSEKEKIIKDQYQAIILEKEKLHLDIDFMTKNHEKDKLLLIESLNEKAKTERFIFEAKLQALESSIEQAKKLAIAEKESALVNSFNEQLNKIKDSLVEKNGEVETLKLALQNQKELLELQFQTKLADINSTHVELLNQKESELNKLKHNKSNLQIKLLGEELERWCDAEYQSYALSGFENCLWRKDTLSKKDSPDDEATKADYIFEIYCGEKIASNKLLSVTIEMKNESPKPGGKKKNSDHYEKLEKDRIKNNSQYSLLVSELEWDALNDAPIRKIPGYENMYMARPAYFMSFICLIKSLAQKYQELLLTKKNESERYAKGEEILKEFEKFKLDYLDKPLEAIATEAEKIKKEATIIYNSANKIISTADLILEGKINDIRAKIERFNIKKIAKQLDKLNDIPE